jgi:hypothetical protein
MTADIRITDHGSIWLLYGTSRAGAAWLAEHLDASALRWGAGIAVEPRYAVAIVEGAVEDGLEVV